MNLKLNDIIKAIQEKHYRLFEDPYELNIVGIRSADMAPNSFNDFLLVFWSTEDPFISYESKLYSITTDPGLYWLEHPSNIEGTGILFPGQYDVYQIDKHRGKYDALCQRRGNVKVYRDDNKNNRFDADKTEEGMFGINIHMAGEDSVKVDKWSAGCQVFQHSDDFHQFMQLCQKHRAIHGNKFVYTLLTEVDLIHI